MPKATQVKAPPTNNLNIHKERVVCKAPIENRPWGMGKTYATCSKACQEIYQTWRYRRTK